MTTQIELGDIVIDVLQKDIKNVHLSVYPPNGRVRISAPIRMDIDTIRVFAISKLVWIKEQQKLFQQQERETSREYLNRESHFLWGKRYLLKLIETDESPSIEIKHNEMILKTRPETNALKKQEIVDGWYRRQLKEVIPGLIANWEMQIGVNVKKFYVQRMKTRWGSCNHLAGSLRFNTELAKKDRNCLEYIVVHEMVHLLEPTHNAQFIALMDHNLPNWRLLRDELNRAPLGHVDWRY
jgi:predicted metal-dependent hydrolase